MTRTIVQLAILTASLSLTACAGERAAAIQPSANAQCEALRPEFPLTYDVGADGKSADQAGFDTRKTALAIRRVNARFAAICPN